MRRPCHAHTTTGETGSMTRIPVPASRRSAHNLYQDVRENGSQDGAVSHPQTEKGDKMQQTPSPRPAGGRYSGQAGPPGRGERRPDCQLPPGWCKGQGAGAAGCLAGAEPDKLGARRARIAIAGQAILCCPNTASGALGSHCSDRVGRVGIEHWLVCLASRPISASTGSVLGLHSQRRPVSLVVDAVSSPHPCQPGSAIAQLAARRRPHSSVEMCLYELMGTAAIRHFARSSPW